LRNTKTESKKQTSRKRGGTKLIEKNTEGEAGYEIFKRQSRIKKQTQTELGEI